MIKTLVYNTYNMQYKIIKKDINKCYFCLEDINYYIKFNCKCHNYLHTKCFENNIFTNCFICKKRIIQKNFINSNGLIITNYLMNKINATHYLNKLTVLTLTSENRLMLILFFIVSILFTFIIIIPCLLLDYILEKIKNLHLVVCFSRR